MLVFLEGEVSSSWSGESVSLLELDVEGLRIVVVDVVVG